MGKIKYIDKIRKFFKDSPVVSIASLKKFIGEKNNKYIYLIINKMLKKNEMKNLLQHSSLLSQYPQGSWGVVAML